MHYSSWLGGFAPIDFLLEIIGIKMITISCLYQYWGSSKAIIPKNGEIDVFADCFLLNLLGFLTTSLHKNCQNDVKLLETWWFGPTG